MNKTVKEDRMYWHVQIFEAEGGSLVLTQKKGLAKIDLRSYTLSEPTKKV